MVYPLLPLFMISVLGTSKTQLGAMEGSAVLIVALMSAVAGIRSDRNRKNGGRVKWIRWGYGLPVIGKAIIALATTWPLVLGGRLLVLYQQNSIAFVVHFLRTRHLMQLLVSG